MRAVNVLMICMVASASFCFKRNRKGDWEGKGQRRGPDPRFFNENSASQAADQAVEAKAEAQPAFIVTQVEAPTPALRRRRLQGMTWGFNNNWANNDMTAGNAATMTKGQGSSMLAIDNDGTSAMGSGTEGAANKADWTNSNNSFGVGNAFGLNGAAGKSGTAGNAGNTKANAFNNNWANTSATSGAVESMALGNGSSQISVGRKGVSAAAQGSLGTSNTGSWKNSVNAYGVGNAYQH